MTDIPPALLQPPHNHLPPLLRPYPAQKPMSPLPHNMARIIRVARPAANLYATEARVRGDFAGEVEGRGRGCGEGSGWGEEGVWEGLGERGAPGGEGGEGALEGRSL